LRRAEAFAYIDARGLEPGLHSVHRQRVIVVRVDRALDRNQGKISADFSKGVLTITLPKSPEAQKQQKKIEVKST